MNANVRPSPWWYRRRGVVLFAIYVSGFLGADFSAGSGPQPAVSSAWGDRLWHGEGAYVLLWIAVASAVVAWILRASGTAYLLRDVVFAAEVQSDRLIVAGPFRYVRNPLYLGNMFLALAAAILAPPVGFFIILIGNAIFAALLAHEESRQMAERYGALYAAFRKHVPAFIPRLTAASVPGSVSVRPAWIPALLGEAFCLATAVAIVPLALFQDAGQPAFWAILISTFAVFTVLGWLAGRKRSAT